MTLDKEFSYETISIISFYIEPINAMNCNITRHINLLLFTFNLLWWSGSPLANWSAWLLLIIWWLLKWWGCELDWEWCKLLLCKWGKLEPVSVCIVWLSVPPALNLPISTPINSVNSLPMLYYKSIIKGSII